MMCRLDRIHPRNLNLVISTIGVIALLAVTSAHSATAVLIDFETDGDGSPWAPAPTGLPADEYAASGVTIHAGHELLFGGALLIEASNQGTSNADGFVIQDGASISFPSQIDLQFDPPIVSVSFDWFTATTVTELHISILDDADQVIHTLVDMADQTFTRNASGIPIYQAGTFSMSFAGSAASRVIIENPPTLTAAVGIDNLSFVAEPSGPPGCDLSGTWEATIVAIDEDCGDGLAPPSVEIAGFLQDGAFVTIQRPGAVDIDGEIVGSILSISWTEPEGIGATSFSGELSINESCDAVDGNVDWTYSEPGFTCDGIDMISAPEPTTVSALMAGLVLLAGISWSRRPRTSQSTAPGRLPTSRRR